MFIDRSDRANEIELQSRILTSLRESGNYKIFDVGCRPDCLTLSLALDF